MQNDAPGIYCATVLSRQNILLESGVSFVGGESVANHEEDDEVLETLEETEEGNSTASHPNYDYNTNYGPKFTLIDKLGTLTLPRRLIDDMDGEVDNYEEYDRHSEKELKVDSSLGQENLFCIKNQILSNDTYGEPILSIRMPQKKSKRRKRLEINLINCRYDSVRRVSQRFGFREVGDDEDWNLYWTDLSVTIERVVSMRKWQKINHFPGMSEICRKDALARNLNRMLKLFPKEYSIFPKTWILPADWGELQQYARQKKNRTYILKPDTGCQGKGIWITKTPREIKATENLICQTYISRPFLIDGFKFDLRLYVLVTSIVPLRVFIFKDGLARFTTQPYREPTAANVGNVFMHLTNYAIQKHSNNFVREDEEAGTKRRITTVNCWLIEHGYDVDKIWHDIDDVILKVLMSGLPVLRHNYRTCFPNHIETSACFEILGFDIMLDRKMRPYVIEVNHSPSFHTDSQLDKEIKEALIWDTLKLANFDAVDRKKCIEEDKRRIRQRLLRRNFGKASREDMNAEMERWAAKALEYENEHLGNFRRIYPCRNNEHYEKYINSTTTLFTETATFKARMQHSRQLREEIRERRDRLESIFRLRHNRLRPESPGRTPAVGSVRRRPSKSRGGTSGGMGRTQGDFVGPSPRGESRSVVSPQHLQPMPPPPLNSLEATRIDEAEEHERCIAMEKRAVLLRSLGVVDAVYRLLSGSPGVVPSSGLPKKMIIADRERTRQQALARPIEIVLPQFPNTSTSNVQSSREPRKLGLHLRPRQSNNSRSCVPSKPGRRAIPISLNELVMSRNLPLLGRGCLHPRVKRECLVNVQGRVEAHLDTLTPGVALSSLGLHLRDVSLTPPQLPSQSQPLLSVLSRGSAVTARVHNSTRCEALRFGVARSSTTSAAASLALTQWTKPSPPKAFILYGTTQPPHQQTFLAANGQNSPVFEEGLCLNGGEGTIPEPQANRNTFDIPMHCVSTKRNTLYARIVDNSNRKPGSAANS
ncbi:tubulin polyglutamylase TTLL13 [Echinococcus multilocularis]|uniref:Tubulin polyglutamylase TTLL13 n=1 Tax=Echinococcus multilocularis TaxID=6211 RepID=A0A068YHF0_ECHMU|nr:tubulin polyglutamylase TTLL13 [Echinococcus multilocularis]